MGPPLLCSTRYKAGSATPLAEGCWGVPWQAAQSQHPGDFPHCACHLGITQALCIPARTVPLRALPGVSFSSPCKAQLRNCFFRKAFLLSTPMPTRRTLSSVPVVSLRSLCPVTHHLERKQP